LWLKWYKKEPSNKIIAREFLETIIWAVILALIIRTWIIQAFKIPSSSMKPTLLVGDHLLVSKFFYGIKLPFKEKTLFLSNQPKRGDIIVFRFPEERNKDFIKRIIGLPHDKVAIYNKIIYINEKPLYDPWGNYTDRIILSSNIQPRDNFGPVIIPPNHYFVMGDNRDQSYDSRFWFNGKGGFVPSKDILGKAIIVYWSWNIQPFKIYWSRFLHIIE